MTAADLGKQLVDHDGISESQARQQRRQKMQAAIDSERSFTNNILRAAMVAWVLTLLGPVGGFLVLLDDHRQGPSVAVFAFLGMLGALAFWIALVTTVAWLFRQRSTTMSTIEMRLASLEELVENSLRRNDDR